MVTKASGTPKGEMSYETKRKSPRFNTTMLARCSTDPSLREYRGNVSAGGFCFHAEGGRLLEPGTSVEILFRVPGSGYWMQAQGMVLGLVEGGDTVGVRGCFTHVEVGDVCQLALWLEIVALSE